MVQRVSDMKGFLREAIITLILAVVIFGILQATVQSSVVSGSSMEPQLEDGQRLSINKTAYFFGEPQRGDVIVCHFPDNTRANYIKRIIGLPGDTVEIKDETVYVNGIELDEPYIAETPSRDYEPYIVEEDHYFVMGDNRNHSRDSRAVGTVAREDIIGKAWLSIWPPSDWGLAPNYSLDEQIAGATGK